ncbi:MAG: serine hydrolase [Patescibacteria group bacterium]
MRTKSLNLLRSIAYILLALEKRINSILVNLPSIELTPNQFYICDEYNKPICGKKQNVILPHLASTSKLLVARACLELVELGKISLSDQVQFETKPTHSWDSIGQTIGDNIDLMLRYSSNSATNVLIESIGGFEKLNAILFNIGYFDSQILNFVLPTTYSFQNTHQKSYSTPQELAKAILEIYCSQNLNFINPLISTPYQFTHTNRVINKLGVNSSTFANVVIVQINDRKYCIVSFYFLPKLLIKVFTISSEILELQSSQSLIFKWDPISYFTQRRIRELESKL